MSSPEHAIITTTAHDIVTNRDLGLPVVVEELADALPDLRTAIGGGTAAGATVVSHHRRLADDPITLEQLSEEFGVSRERVRQIEVRAFEKVQKAVREALIVEGAASAPLALPPA